MGASATASSLMLLYLLHKSVENRMYYALLCCDPDEFPENWLNKPLKY
jgi:hypothetical protein